MNYLGIRLIGTSFLCCVLFCVDPAGSGELACPCMAQARAHFQPQPDSACLPGALRLCPPAVGTSWSPGRFPTALSCLRAAPGPPRPPLPSGSLALLPPCSVPAPPTAKHRPPAPVCTPVAAPAKEPKPWILQGRRRVRWASGARVQP